MLNPFKIEIDAKHTFIYPEGATTKLAVILASPGLFNLFKQRYDQLDQLECSLKLFFCQKYHCIQV